MLSGFADLSLEDEVEDMDTSDTPWFWFYKAKCGIWHRVEDDPKNFMSSDDLDRYYLRNPTGVVNVTAAGAQFEVNFAESMQVNLKTGKSRRIKRSFQTGSHIRCKCDDISPSIPAHWESVDPKKPFQLVSLRKDSSEYQKMERYAREDGLLQDPIVSISRIQNVDLWELFCRRKIHMMRTKGQSHIEEQNLFHGTKSKNLPSIYTYNFNCRLSDKRRVGHVLGKGTYFAKHAALASGYSDRTPQGTKLLLIARVIVGKYKAGRYDYCTPDDDQGENVHIHDSCVDNVHFPRIFVIFDSNQIYPEYVLEYRGH